jgi:electron transfer flavoprotein alpha subunit
VDVVEQREHLAFRAVRKIVVLVKQVPHPEAIDFDQETKTLKREGVPLILNPFDRAAVRLAVDLQEQTGGEVVTMTMGPPAATDALRETLALGADRAVHLSDRAFAVADTLGTSRTIALALRKEGDVDLVLTGRKTVDSETWQVPPEVASFLGWPQIVSALSIDAADGGLRVLRELDGGEDEYEVELPAVVSVGRADETPVQATDGHIDVWTAADLVDDLAENDKRFGQTGSPTRVLAVRDVTPERAGTRVTSWEEGVEAVRGLLQEREAPSGSWEKPPHLAEQPAAEYNAWSVVETREGRPTRPSLELVAKARELSGKLGGRSAAVLVGHELDEAAREAVRHGAESAYIVDDESLPAYDAARIAAALRIVVERERPHVLLIPASARGRDYGPRLAGDLQVGMTGDCVNVDIAKAGRLLQTKPAYGGNIVSVIMGATNPQLATVRSRMFAPLEPRDVAGEIHRVALDEVPRARTKLLRRRGGTDAWRLDEADIVVLLGPNGGPPDEVAGIAREAGAAFGATRDLCESGAVPWSYHVGLYGRPVAPRVLVAVGVPDDFEHLTGFVKADVVVALPEADWTADVHVRADATVLPQLVRRLAELV